MHVPPLKTSREHFLEAGLERYVGIEQGKVHLVLPPRPYHLWEHPGRHPRSIKPSGGVSWSRHPQLP